MFSYLPINIEIEEKKIPLWYKKLSEKFIKKNKAIPLLEVVSSDRSINELILWIIMTLMSFFSLVCTYLLYSS